MTETIVIGLAEIIILGISAQWLAWRLKLPSILFLLLFGFIAGPVLGILNPDAIMGDTLLPVVTMSVAIVLFEGGLTLSLKDLKSVGGTVISLISIGVLITWIIAALGAYFILGMNIRISILLGAVLVVTGPTVIGPLLNHIKPKGKVGKVLKWEGIVIDPVGALLAVLVFEAILVQELQHASSLIALGIFKTVVIGGGIGIGLAYLLIFLLKRYLIPDFLQESMTFMLVILGFVISNHFQAESGLFAATVMGIMLDNQNMVTIKNIAKFKENLKVIIISSLFILLAARLELEAFLKFDWNTLIFLLLLIFVGRPLSVFISTLKSTLTIKEKLFLSWMAPRGIVAAAVASVFAFKLGETDLDQTSQIVPITFMVIIGTVAIYGLTAPWLAKKLKIAQSDPQGVLFIGAFVWVRKLAKIIQNNGFNVALIDTSLPNINAAEREGLKAYHGNVLSEAIADEIELDGIGKLAAFTPNDEVNAMAALNFSEHFDSEHIFQLKPHLNESKGFNAHAPKHLRGRFLFSDEFFFETIKELTKEGFVFEEIQLSKKNKFEDLVNNNMGEVVPLFSITQYKKLKVFIENADWQPGENDKIVVLKKANSK
jgi:NhaP-type Na+/H+ or K+/H+ antiporter